MKHSVAAWMAIKNGLKTKALLRSRNVLVDPRCIFCLSSLENTDHLFSRCMFAKEIWDQITSKLHLSSPDDLSFEDQLNFPPHACRQHHSGNITLAKLCFASFVWPLR